MRTATSPPRPRWPRAVALAASAFGGLDVLFNNAGVSDTTWRPDAIDADKWSWIFDLLVRGPALGIKHAAPLMRGRGGGSIINTASVAALQAGYGPLAYSSAKAALLHMTRCMAAQLSPQKIRVNAICPGLIATSIFGASFGLPRHAADRMAAMIGERAAGVQPIPAAGAPDDVARAALYLASDEARFVTGTHIVVDGGLSVGPRHSWDAASPSPLAALFGDLAPGEPVQPGG